MSVLRDRIIGQGSSGPAYHPHGTPATPMTMPLARVIINGTDVGLDELHPIVAGDSQAGIIPATAPGRWGQVVAAGRP